jgi:hypothetical protein
VAFAFGDDVFAEDITAAFKVDLLLSEVYPSAGECALLIGPTTCIPHGQSKSLLKSWRSHTEMKSLNNLDMLL